MSTNNRKPKPKQDKKFIMNIHKINKKDELRIQKWSMGVMKKLDLAGKLNLNKYRARQIVARGEVTAENVDIGEVYRFPELEWYVFHDKGLWTLCLTSQGRMLAYFHYANIS